MGKLGLVLMGRVMLCKSLVQFSVGGLGCVPSLLFDLRPNYARGNENNGDGDRIPVELFQILKDDAVKLLHSTCQQIWETQQWPQGWKRPVFVPIPKNGNAK